jgi:ADP-ribose pyrophosphatase YjhB (NUDIX family)
MSSDPPWLQWARELQAIAQNGLLFSKDVYDRQRYEAVRNVAAQMMARGADHPVEAVAGIFAAQTGYATPKVDVRGVVFRDGQILLVREAQDGRWTPPGGWADPNETLAESVTREVFEEAGFKTRAVKLLAVFDRSKHGHLPLHPFHVYKFFVLCEIESGEPRTSVETLEVGFFPEDSIPELSLGRVTPGQISRCFEHLRNPDWPTDFD